MATAPKTRIAEPGETGGSCDPARLHLIKLSVGSESVESLADWQSARMAERVQQDPDPYPRHVTRMTPRRGDELLPGGSIYWVIQGSVLVRQPLRALVPVRGEDGVARCAVVMERVLIRVEPRLKRPFQGWRYLTVADAPPDLTREGAEVEALPPELREALARYGLD